jgi:hypothetical protein
MAPRLLTILTGRNLPQIRQSREAEPSIINDKTIADFTRVVEQTGIRASHTAAATDKALGDFPLRQFMFYYHGSKKLKTASAQSAANEPAEKPAENLRNDQRGDNESGNAARVRTSTTY